MKTLRLFISSPGDVGRERHATAEVIRRLQNEFAEDVTLDPYFWEWEPVDFGKDYQANIPSTADFDIVICLLWSRLGSQLGEQHKLPPDYTQPASSGTEYELLQALHGKRNHPEKLPDLLVWVNKAPPPPATSPPLSRKEEDERIQQRRALQDFLASLTRDASSGIFTAAVNRYEIPGEDIESYQYLDQFEELMEHKLRKLIQKHVGQRTIKPKAQWQGSPFRDLDVFEFQHARIFFGRSRAVGEVVRLFQSSLTRSAPSNFALVLGASGSGKSSLARAGVLPLLTRPNVIEGIGLWRCAIMRPSDDSADLFHALAAALLRTQSLESDGCPAALPELADPESNNPQQVLADELRAHPETVAIRVKDKLIEAARAHDTRQRRSVEEQIASFKKEGRHDDAVLKQQTLRHLTAPVSRLALLLDQMEELFTLNYASDHLHAFLRAVDVLARSGRVFVLGTLRSDFYPRYQGQEILVALARDGARFDLLPPTADEISQIIRRPATLAGLQFEEDEATRHSLADTLRDEALADAEALPLLEHVLNRLYQLQAARADGRLTLEDHRRLGGVGGALGKHAEETFAKLAFTDATLDAVFRCLITLGEGEQEVPNRRTFAYDDLVQADPAASLLVDTFIRERLLVADRDAQSRAVVRLSHEALLIRWPRLTQWLQTAQVRDFMAQRRRLESSLRQWQEQGRNSDYLLAVGLPLEEARQLLKSHDAALKPEEKAFIIASSTHHQQRERRASRLRWMAFSVLSALTVLATVAGSIAWRMKTQADRERARQEALLWTASRGDHAAAMRAFVEHRHVEGLAYLNRALAYRPMNTDAFIASAAHTFGLHAPAWRTRSVFAFQGPVQCVAFSPDGRLLAVGSGPFDGRVIEVTTGREISRLECSASSMCFSPDGRAIAVVRGDEAARVLDAATGRQIQALAFGGDVNSISLSRRLPFDLPGSTLKVERNAVTYSPDGRWVAAASNDKSVRVMEAATGGEISKTMFDHEVTSVSFSPDGRFIAAGSADNTARVMEASTGKEISKLTFGGRVTSVSFSPDGLLLAAGSADTTVQMMEVATGTKLHTLDFGDGITSLSFSPDVRLLAVGSIDGTLRVIETGSRSEIQRLEFGGRVETVSFSPDGRFLAVGGGDKTVRMLEAATGKEIQRLEFGENVQSVNFSHDGRFLATGSGDLASSAGEVRITEAATGKETRRLKVGPGIHSVNFSPDGLFLVAGVEDKTARLIEVATGKEVKKMVFGDEVTSVSFSPDGRFLAAVVGRKLGRKIEVNSGKETSIPESGHSVNSLSFSPDGRFLAAGSDDMTLRVMEAATGKVIRTLKFDLGVQSVSFSPDSRFLAVGSLDWKARVVDAVTGQEISTLEFDQSVTSVSFSPDGCFLAAASPDRTTRVAEVATGKEIWRLEGYILANSVSFSADGRFLAVASADRTARVFDCTWFKLREEMSAHWRSALLMQSSRQFLPDGRLAQLSADELLAAQQDLTAFVSVEPKPDQRWQHAILKWSQMPVDQRTTSPWTTETIRTVIGYQLMQVDLEGTDTRSANSAPWHPLAPVSLARLEPRPPPGGTTIFPPGTIDPIVRSVSGLLTRGKPGSYGLIGEPAQGTTRIIFLARLTLKRLRDADEKLYGREPLAEYAAWAAKIMHEELHCEAEALEAINFALERTPKDKQENLLELKARLAPTK